jgi:lipopolysaccharide transport system ATP-binding protein
MKKLSESLIKLPLFADIGEHLDRAVKTYSSGMMLRLAFAVQMAVEPEILIIDEALAVGDARFQLKCFRRLEELKANGTTILFVSHSVELIKSLCDQGLLLDSGKANYWGESQVAATKYYEILFPKNNEVRVEQIESQPNEEFKIASESELLSSSLKEAEQRFSEKNHIIMSFKKNDLKMSWGRGGAFVNNVNISGLKHPNILVRGSNVQVSLQLHLNFDEINKISEKEGCSQNLFVGIRCDSSRGISVFDIFHEVTAKEISLIKEQEQCTLDLEFEIEVPELCQGNYFLSYGAAIGRVNQVVPLYSCDNVTMLTLESNNQILGQMRPKYTSKRVL